MDTTPSSRHDHDSTFYPSNADELSTMEVIEVHGGKEYRFNAIPHVGNPTPWLKWRFNKEPYYEELNYLMSLYDDC